MTQAVSVPTAGSGPFFHRPFRHGGGFAIVDTELMRLTCRLTDVRAEGEALDYDIRLYLRGDVAALRAIAPGQRVEATGHLWSPDAATNPGEFDFSAYLWRNGMAAYATANLSDAQVTGEPVGLQAWLHTLRNAMGERIDVLFPRSAQVVRALVLGDRGDMDEDLRDSFNRAGVAHVLSISGLHITMLAMAMMSLLSLFLPPALGVLDLAHTGSVLRAAGGHGRIGIALYHHVCGTWGGASHGQAGGCLYAAFSGVRRFAGLGTRFSLRTRGSCFPLRPRRACSA